MSFIIILCAFLRTSTPSQFPYHSFDVVKLPFCVKLSILPSKNSSCLYAALGWYCGTI